MRKLGKRGLKNRKGQVAIFVIAAVVIVALVALFFLFRNRLPGIGASELSPSSFLKSCIEPEVERGIELLAQQGGYRNIEGSIMHQGKKIKYLCYTDDYYETCVVQQPMIKNNFEDELEEIIRPKANECARSLISEYESRGYRVSSGDVVSSVSINPGKINVNVNSPMTIAKDTSQTFSEFNIEIDSEMYELLFTAQSIIEYEAGLGDSASELYLQYYPDISIEKTKLSDGTTIYKISNVITNEEFVFASRSLAWPAGYGLEG